MRSCSRIVLAGLAGALLVSGCATANAGSATRTVAVSATLTGYDTALVPPGAQASVVSTTSNGSTTVRLTVQGLLPGRRYGAHAHTQPCGPTGAAAGPHYQHTPDPVQPSVDPAYANPQNEIWLDLTTDAAGAGAATTAVAWAFSGESRANSVIIHAMPTATDAGHAGTAGARAGCITVGF